MRPGLYIPQRAIVEKDLLGKVTTDAWLLLDYLRGWVTCKNVKKVQIDGREFFWIRYRHACRELPVLFPNRPILRTQLNKLVRLIASLKDQGLIDTARLGPRCYVHITRKAQELYAKPTAETFSRIGHHTMSTNDGCDMDNRDGHIMRNDDGTEELNEEKEHAYTNNSDSNDRELECVKRRLERIFPVRNWSKTDIASLRRQMPIPEWELKLMTRFYTLPMPTRSGVFAKDLVPHDFLLVRRRQSMRTLLEHWSDEVPRALAFFETFGGRREAESHGWDLSEMRSNGES